MLDLALLPVLGQVLADAPEGVADTTNFRNGSAGAKTNAILDATKPEAVYFTEMNGRRTAVILVELANPSRIPAFAEPWFLNFDAEFYPVMSPEEPEKAGLDKLGEK